MSEEETEDERRRRLAAISKEMYEDPALEEAYQKAHRTGGKEDLQNFLKLRRARL